MTVSVSKRGGKKKAMPVGPRQGLSLAAVVILAAAAYANTLGYGPAWDAQSFVADSGAMSGLTAAPEMLTRPFWKVDPPGFSPYRPLTVVSYALDWSLSGGHWPFLHWMNVALHAAVTALVFALLIRLGAPLLASTVAAAVFAVHPVHVEVAANLAGRADLLACLFVLLAVFTYLGPASRHSGAGGSSGTPGWGRQVGVLTFFLLAVGLRDLLKGWPLWLGVAGVAAGYMAVRVAVLRTMATLDVAPSIAALSTPTRITTAISLWFQYLRLMLFPNDFSVDYGPAVTLPTTASDLDFWLGLGAGVGVLALAAISWRARPLITLGVAWFAISVFPVSNLFVPIAVWMAERFLYLPSVGFVFVVAGGVAWAQERRLGTRRVLLVLLVAALIAMTVRTWKRNETWEDSNTVFTASARRWKSSILRSSWRRTCPP